MLDLATHYGEGAPVVADAARHLKGHEQQVLGMVTNRVDKCVCSVSADFSARLWDVEAGRCVSVLNGHRGAVRDASFSPDARTVLTAGDDCVKLWDRSTGKIEQTLKGHFGHVTSVDVVDKDIGGVADGLIVLTGGWDQSLKLWDLRVGYPIRTCLGHTAAVSSCFISRDHSVTYSVGADCLLRVFEIKLSLTLPPFDLDNPPGGARLARSVKMCAQPLHRARMSRNAEWLASTTAESALCLTKLGPDVTTMLRMKEGGGAFAWDTDFRSDGKMVIFSSGEEVMLWGIGGERTSEEDKYCPNATCLARLKGAGFQSSMWGQNAGEAWGCCFLDDAVLCGGGDGVIAVWNIDKEIQGDFGSCIS